jgi:hypothetical protein
MQRMMMLLLAAACAAGSLAAQVPPDREALLNGDGDGIALPAESNGYPGPKNVLDLADRLGLSAQQKLDIRGIYDDMHARARAIGKMIVKVEEELDYALSAGMVKQESVEDDTESIGKLRGTLRGVLLGAHLKTKEILTKKQLELYAALRKELREKDPKAPPAGERPQ